jgi:hypothetical protein
MMSRQRSLFPRTLLGGLATIAVVTSLAGCVTQQVLPYQPAVINQTRLGSLPRTARLQVATLDGEPQVVQTTIRSMRIAAPGNGSWSAFLDQALRTELTVSGNYDPNAPMTIEATLSEVEIADGQAALTGHFVVRQAQVVRYDKVLHVEKRWDSDFLAVLAASSGLNQTTAIFQELLGKLFADPDFIKAT